jgi:hypothetical protein
MSTMLKPPVESSDATGEPFPPTPAEAMTSDLGRSDCPYGRAGMATAAFDLAGDLETGVERAEYRRERDGETNGAVVISENAPVGERCQRNRNRASLGGLELLAG